MVLAAINLSNERRDSSWSQWVHAQVRKRGAPWAAATGFAQNALSLKTLELYSHLKSMQCNAISTNEEVFENKKAALAKTLTSSWSMFPAVIAFLH